MCLSASIILASGTEQDYNLSVDVGILDSETITPNTTAMLVDAPLNPDFLEYRERNSRRVVFAEAEAEASGLIPSPVDFSRLNSLVFSAEPEIPSAYDLRAEGRITPAKDQGLSGACWAFASFASLESNLAPSELRDFSENNIKNLLSSQYSDGFDRLHSGGGNDLMAAAYLARWSGPVDESDDPFNDWSGVSSEGFPVQKHVQNIFLMPPRSNSLDNENIKLAVLKYGAVYTTIYSVGLKDSYYDSTHNSSYYPSGSIIDHAVSIVGWNDSYPAEYFSNNPGGDGAFIIKNSWGDDWGENGYCYVSYYDAVLGKKAENSVFLPEDSLNYDRIYQYDPLGWVSQTGYKDTETAWQANVFTAESAEILKAVSFYTVNSNTEYEVRVYLDPDSGPLNREGVYVLSQNGSFDFSGYHTVLLENGINLSSGQSFSVVVKLTTPGETAPLAVEKLEYYYSSQAEAGPLESYLSSDGALWDDLTTFSGHEESNFCIKAFTSTVPLPEAAFSANLTSGVRPLTVEFTDSSVHAESWAWDVDGDGNPDYNTQNLSHTYSYPGIYNVSLTVSSSCGSDTVTKYGYINVLNSLAIVQYPPTENLSTLEGKPTNFSLETDELCNFTWSIDGKPDLKETMSMASVYSNSTASPGTYDVSVAADSGYETVRYAWNWIVFDWNPWDEPGSEENETVTTTEVQEAIHCWLNNEIAPETGAEVMDERLEELFKAWLED